MRYRSLAAATAMTLVVLTALPALASAEQPRIVPANSTYAGRSYAQWSAAWWQWSIRQPAEHHPLSGAIDQNGTPDPLAHCEQGQSGPVWFLGGVVNSGSTVTRMCSVPPNTALYLPLGNSECSDLEQPPFFGADTADRRSCAETFIDANLDRASLTAQIDGVAAGHLDRQRVTSPDFPFALPRCPAGNVLGVDCSLKRGNATDSGYYLLLRPFDSGRHTIHFTASFGPGFGLDITYRIDVGG